jgi:hypothetical protein
MSKINAPSRVLLNPNQKQAEGGFQFWCDMAYKLQEHCLTQVLSHPVNGESTHEHQRCCFE